MRTERSDGAGAWINRALALAFLLAFLHAVCACAFAVLLPRAHAASGEASNTLGQSTPQGYLLDKQTAVYRTVASADGELGAAATSVADIVLDGRQTLSVSPRFTSATGTAVLEVVYYYKAADGTYTILTSERVTVLAGSTREAAGSGRYLPDTPPTFDSRGANRVEIRVPSWAGSESSMTLWVGTY